ncbi:CopY/TcrY family copper transport repressor [Enterococcus sp. PF1-24]|uniref:CopY/TcrY family copper transport repressor n=1 Tax=unclassified Enterococcus TaxID=2608891 RepID=UPI0024771B35|nr:MULTISPECIES: CopY/TcrY family copper transport repressor [unclassified Enterococcus]MDH6365294.1 CopY/TcrY family copper transport repressor [Enterococcus sp. PFB1-1]MDH6402376.1 CopY/TcrY family copper transport repressor [Enterococcus sp. PF1-24]
MAEVKEPLKISDSEWEIMRVIWTLQEATAQQIVGILSDSKEWKPATVKTLLGRLVKKDVLATEQAGKRFIYRPLVSEKDTVKSATESLFSHICAKQIGQTIAELVEQADLTATDLNLIKQKVEGKQPVSEITCNCIPGQCQCSHHQE